MDERSRTALEFDRILDVLLREGTATLRSGGCPRFVGPD